MSVTRFNQGCVGSSALLLSCRIIIYREGERSWTDNVYQVILSRKKEAAYPNETIMEKELKKASWD